MNIKPPPQPRPEARNASQRTPADLADLGNRLEAAVLALAAEDVPAFVGLLETVKARVMLRMLTPAVPALATDDVVDVKTLAAELGLAESWLRAAARTNKLPHVRAGKYIKFCRSEVLAALSRPGAGHRMASPVKAEKPSNGGPRVSACFHAEAEK